MFQVIEMPYDDYINGKYDSGFTGIIKVYTSKLTDFNLEQNFRLLIDEVVYVDKERWLEELSEADQVTALFHLGIWR